MDRRSNQHHTDLNHPRVCDFDVGMGTNLPSGADPWIFSTGLNTILESRAAFLNSSANSTSLSDISTLPCLDTATTTTSSGSSSSETGIQMTWAADLSPSPSCQNSTGTLLADLLPLNATGKVIPVSAHEGWLVLNTTQVELLGLNSQTLLLAPFVVPAWEQTVSGGPPTNYAGELGQTVENGLNALKGDLVAFGNFLGTVSAALVAFGQWVVGVFENAPGAIAAAISTAISVLTSWFNIVLIIANALFAIALEPLMSIENSYGMSVYRAAFAMNQTVAGGGRGKPD